MATFRPTATWGTGTWGSGETSFVGTGHTTFVGSLLPQNQSIAGRGPCAASAAGSEPAKLALVLHAALDPRPCNWDLEYRHSSIGGRKLAPWLPGAALVRTCRPRSLSKLLASGRSQRCALDASSKCLMRCESEPNSICFEGIYYALGQVHRAYFGC